jgi:hypothetical protein
LSPSGAGYVPKWCGHCPQVARASSPSGAGYVPKWCGPCPQVVRALSPSGAGSVPKWCGHYPHVVRAMSPSGAGNVPKWCGLCPQVARTLSASGAGVIPNCGKGPQARAMSPVAVSYRTVGWAGPSGLRLRRLSGRRPRLQSRFSAVGDRDAPRASGTRVHPKCALGVSAGPFGAGAGWIGQACSAVEVLEVWVVGRRRAVPGVSCAQLVGAGPHARARLSTFYRHTGTTSTYSSLCRPLGTLQLMKGISSGLARLAMKWVSWH